MKTCLSNATIVLADEVLENAALLIEDGVISAVDPASTTGAEIIDLAGKLLMPGMIDLHCDALEKEVEPRPNVHFPLDFACAQADKRNAVSGITTVYHALSFANDELGISPGELPVQCMTGGLMAWSITGCIAATRSPMKPDCRS
ncbi:MAG: hypothetical protein V2J55_11455 [Candidatus Competibacteraceae bacterium]|jgi:alpha-D-ribose 1-methylphosphonate 5-triphosphate diphosphatase|nr:hypothetical protein [Candidatus Competibacteraceae bacterium]